MTRSGALKYDAKRIANTRVTATAGALADAGNLLDTLDLRDALDDIEELHQRVRDALDAAASREAYLTSAPSPPVPMILTCPSCGGRHVDVGDKPHHTHACQHCGMVWRPAVVDTVGVQFLPGYKNEEPTAPPSIVWRREVWSPGMCPGHPDPHAASGDGAQVEKEAAANVAADHYLPGDQLKIPRRLGETGDRTWTRWLLIQHDKGSIWVAKRMADDGTVERHRTSGVDVRYAGRRLPTVPVKH